MWTFLSLNNEVNNWADSLCLAIIKTPDVSLSSLWTEKGFVFWKISLLANMSTRFFLDLVPPWTEMPELLFNTIKSSLLSIIKSSFSLMTSSEGINFIFFWTIVFLLSSLLSIRFSSFLYSASLPYSGFHMPPFFSSSNKHHLFSSSLLYTSYRISSSFSHNFFLDSIL